MPQYTGRFMFLWNTNSSLQHFFKNDWWLLLSISGSVRFNSGRPVIKKIPAFHFQPIVSKEHKRPIYKPLHVWPKDPMERSAPGPGITLLHKQFHLPHCDSDGEHDATQGSSTITQWAFTVWFYCHQTQYNIAQHSRHALIQPITRSLWLTKIMVGEKKL